MMEQFSWPEVAKIAGVLLTLLLGVIGSLLAVLLYKQKGAKDVMLTEVKKSNNSLGKKVEAEIDDRRESTRQLYMVMEKHREERREDIKELSNKMGEQSGEIASHFNEICTSRQKSCSTIVHAEIDNQKEKLNQICSKIVKVQENRDSKWAEQRKLNMQILSKTNQTGGVGN